VNKKSSKVIRYAQNIPEKPSLEVAPLPAPPMESGAEPTILIHLWLEKRFLRQWSIALSLLLTIFLQAEPIPVLAISESIS